MRKKLIEGFILSTFIYFFLSFPSGNIHEATTKYKYNNFIKIPYFKYNLPIDLRILEFIFG